MTEEEIRFDLDAPPELPPWEPTLREWVAGWWRAIRCGAYHRYLYYRYLWWIIHGPSRMVLKAKIYFGKQMVLREADRRRKSRWSSMT